MGLDLVELAMEVEETFGVVISDDAAVEIRTVGQLYDYILQYRGRERGCPTSGTFYAIRRVIVDAGGVPKRAVRPSTRLTSILPPRLRRRVWKSMHQQGQGWRVRGLRLPYRLGPTSAVLTLICGAVGAILAIPHVGIEAALVLAATGTAMGLLLLIWLTRPLAVAFPSGVPTVGDLTLAALPPGYDIAAKAQWDDREIWQKLQAIVVDILGAKPEEVTPSARFIEDLGAG